jgi:Skp family chaperone for outer membrane proteins
MAMVKMISSGRPFRKEVTDEIEQWKKESAEKLRKMQEESAQKRQEREAAEATAAS